MREIAAGLAACDRDDRAEEVVPDIEESADSVALVV